MTKRRTKAFATGLLLLAVILPLAGQGKLTVATAANLAPVTSALAAAFARANTTTLEFVLGATGTLATQLQNGAPFDVFLAADTETPQKLADAGLTTAPRVYALGKLLLFSLKPRDFAKGLKLLADPAVTQVAVANPLVAPYGRAAAQALTQQGLWETVQPKLVTAQNVTQALQFTLQGTGLGFVAKSSLYTKDLTAYLNQEGVHWLEVDPQSYAPIAQAAAVLKASPNRAKAEAFVDFLTTPDARAVFAGAGYGVP